MDYNESHSDRKRRPSSGFYIILAVALLAVGALAWFAMSRITDAGNNNSSDMPPVSSDIGGNSDNSEYNGGNSSYNESEMPMPGTNSGIIEPTADSVSDQPYSESKPQSTETPSVFMMPVEGEILKNFSDTALQYSSTYSDMRLHTGVDIACKKGTSVSSCADGKVINIELNTSMGNVITIDHSNGVVAKYSAIDNIKVEKGDTVKAGDIIGTSATVPSECNDEAHLHLEVYKNEKAVDPMSALGLNK